MDRIFKLTNKQSYEFERIEQNIILFQIEGKMIYAFNHLGSLIIDLFVNNNQLSESEINRRISEIFEVGEDVIRTDIQCFLDKISELNIIERIVEDNICVTQ